MWGGGRVKCCVPGCLQQAAIMHRFPHPKIHHAIYLEWVHRIPNLELRTLPPDEVYRNKKVCRHHFENKYQNQGSKRLHWNAVPTLYLNVPCGTALTTDGQQSVPSSSAVGIHHREMCTATDHDHTYCLRVPTNLNTSTSICREGTSGGLHEIMDESGSSFSTDLQNSSSLVLPDNVKHGASQERCNIPGEYTITLKSVGVKRQHELTPKAKKLYHEVVKLQRQAKRKTEVTKSFRRRLFAAEKLSYSKALNKTVPQLNPITSHFIQCQLREAGRPPKLRRFTPNEKIFALSLYKNSPKSYRFLSNVFTLPSKETLRHLLKKLPLKAGINEVVFEILKKSVETLDEESKYVAILFDEMALMPHLNFNEAKGCIEGFEDLGAEKRRLKFADHALVFMIRGLKRRFKQPIAYMFSESAAKYFDLKEVLISIIRKVQDTGLKPIVTICDQSTINVKLINSLMEDTRIKYLQRNSEYRHGFFEVDDAIIYPIFDPPHLIKGIRNNLLDKDIEFVEGGKKKIAKWSHVQQLYEADNYVTLRACPQLTDYHIIPNKIKKMKVKCATQVFSQRVASVMRLLANMSTGENFPQEATDTADLLFFFDQLFDSVNGTTLKPERGKFLRCALTAKSPHTEFWGQALKILNTMWYIHPITKQKTRPPSLVNWTLTLQNIQAVWKVLHCKGYKFLICRNLNQDPIENFFGSIRSQGVTNIMPTCAGFAGAYKTLLVTNLFSVHSVDSNCEKDESTGLLGNFKSILFRDREDPLIVPEEQEQPLKVPIDDIPLYPLLASEMGKLISTYVAGFVLKKIVATIKDCSTCKNECFARDPNLPQYQLILAREFGGDWPCRLKYPSEGFITAFTNIHHIVDKHLRLNCISNSFVLDVKQSILRQVLFRWLTCAVHRTSVFNLIADNILRVVVHSSWVKDINNKLCGKDTRPYQGSDKMKLLAVDRYKKYKYRKKMSY